MAASSGSHSYPYPRPAVTVDVVALSLHGRSARLLLIERRQDPFAGCWALPGGFVDAGETLEHAARRELAEETGLAADGLWPIGAFGDPGRDPRGWTISAAFGALIPWEHSAVAPASDAIAVDWKSFRRPPKLAFDHQCIVDAAQRRLSIDLYATAVLAPWLPTPCSLEQFATFARALDPKAPTGETLRGRLESFSAWRCEGEFVLPRLEKRGKRPANPPR